MTLRALASTAGIVLLTLVLAPLQLLFIRFGRPSCRTLPRFYHRIALRLIGVRVRVIGEPVATGPVLFVANHISWLDIPVISAVLPCSFIAKREVGDWGPFGTLARLQRTVFIDRDRRRDARQQGQAIASRLASGDMLVLFAEGTSTDGSMVLPFKSALFAVAAPGRADVTNGNGVDDLMVQPMTVTYRTINGVPLSRATRPLIGWYGDMELGPHFLNILGLGRITVDLYFHRPVPASAYPSRKALAEHCHGEVRAGLLAARRGNAAALP